MPRRVVIVGNSDEGIALLPLLESSPEVEICAIACDDRARAREALHRADPSLPGRFVGRITTDIDAALRVPGLDCAIDAGGGLRLDDRMHEALERGIQVTTPSHAKLLFAFGAGDARRKPELLRTLHEIIASYNFTIDRQGLLDRILQIAVGATGADRGSLMLWDAGSRRLRVEVAIGIEEELIPKIRLRPGEGIAGLAFAQAAPILVSGKADSAIYEIARERDDVESAISTPLESEGRVIGVLNLSHARRRGAFSDEDLAFVGQLARLDAEIIARAEEYHALRRDSARLRVHAEVRELMWAREPLAERAGAVCRFVAEQIPGGLCRLFVRDPDLGVLVLRAFSAGDLRGSRVRLEPDEGIHGWVARSREPVFVSERIGAARVCYATLPLSSNDDLIGVLAFEGVIDGRVPDLLRDRLRSAADSLETALGEALQTARLERRAARSAALTEAAAALSPGAEPAELERRIVAAAASLLDAEHAVLRLRDADSGRYSIRAYSGCATGDHRARLLALEKSLSIEAGKLGAALRVVDRESLHAFAPETSVDCALVQPLRCDGELAGTLCVLGRIHRDSFEGESFGEADEKLLARYGEHARSAVTRARDRQRARQQQRIDGLTGLPNRAGLSQRVREELARATQRGRDFALVRLAVAGLSDVFDQRERSDGDRLVLSIAEELRSVLRDFDVLARTGDDTFEMLIPEPDSDVSALLDPLAHRVRSAIERQPADSSARADFELELGYAVFPDDGRTPQALITRATTPRVRSA